MDKTGSMTSNGVFTRDVTGENTPMPHTKGKKVGNEDLYERNKSNGYQVSLKGL